MKYLIAVVVFALYTGSIYTLGSHARGVECERARLSLEGAGKDVLLTKGAEVLQAERGDAKAANHVEVQSVQDVRKIAYLSAANAALTQRLRSFNASSNTALQTAATGTGVSADDGAEARRILSERMAEVEDLIVGNDKLINEASAINAAFAACKKKPD